MKENKVGVNNFSADKIIVVFDGVCNLCNAAVDFLIARDKRNVFLFGSFQHENVRAMLGSEFKDEPPSTIYVIPSTPLKCRTGMNSNSHVLEESAALFYLANYLPYPWRLVIVFRILPRFLTNAVYRFIARNRYRWFGEKSTCRLPTQEERSKFI